MSKMQWQVSLNAARSSRRARSWIPLVLVSLLGWDRLINKTVLKQAEAANLN